MSNHGLERALENKQNFIVILCIMGRPWPWSFGLDLDLGLECSGLGKY